MNDGPSMTDQELAKQVVHQWTNRDIYRVTWVPGTPIPVPDKVRLARAYLAAIANERMRRDDAGIPNAETLRLHMGELTAEEVRIAKAAYRLALHHATELRSDNGELATQGNRITRSIQEASERQRQHKSRKDCKDSPYWTFIESDRDHWGWNDELMRQDERVCSEACESLLEEITALRAQLGKRVLQYDELFLLVYGVCHTYGGMNTQEGLHVQAERIGRAYYKLRKYLDDHQEDLAAAQKHQEEKS